MNKLWKDTDESMLEIPGEEFEQQSHDESSITEVVMNSNYTGESENDIRLTGQFGKAWNETSHSKYKSDLYKLPEV